MLNTAGNLTATAAFLHSLGVKAIELLSYNTGAGDLNDPADDKQWQAY